MNYDNSRKILNIVLVSDKMPLIANEVRFIAKGLYCTLILPIYILEESYFISIGGEKYVTGNVIHLCS